LFSPTVPLLSCTICSIGLILHLFKMAGRDQELSFEGRKEEARRIRLKYPNRVPVICQPARKSDLPNIEKKKLLVPMTMLIAEFKFVIQKHIANSLSFPSQVNLSNPESKTIYLFVNNTAPKAGAMMSQIDEQHVSDDGFLYMQYAAENTLGHPCPLVG